MLIAAACANVCAAMQVADSMPSHGVLANDYTIVGLLNAVRQATLDRSQVSRPCLADSVNEIAYCSTCLLLLGTNAMYMLMGLSFAAQVVHVAQMITVWLKQHSWNGTSYAAMLCFCADHCEVGAGLVRSIWASAQQVRSPSAFLCSLPGL